MGSRVRVAASKTRRRAASATSYLGYAAYASKPYDESIRRLVHSRGMYCSPYEIVISSPTAISLNVFTTSVLPLNITCALGVLE